MKIHRENETLPFCRMALVIPAAEAAIGTNWLPTLISALGAELLCTWLNGNQKPKLRWLSCLRILALSFLLASFLEPMQRTWADDRGRYAVPAVILALAVYASTKGNGMRRAANVLRYGMYAVLGILAYASIKRTEISGWMPSPELPSASLAVILLLPLLQPNGERGKALFLFPFPILAALLTAGTKTDNLYAYARGLSLHGVAEHLESLAACAATVGWFALVCYITEAFTEEFSETQKEAGKYQAAILTVPAYLIWIFGLTPKKEAVCALLLTLWGIIPLFCTLKKKMKKVEKRA